VFARHVLAKGRLEFRTDLSNKRVAEIDTVEAEIYVLCRVVVACHLCLAISIEMLETKIDCLE